MIKKVFSIILISLFVFSVYAQAAENTEENPVQDTAAVEAEIKADAAVEEKAAESEAELSAEEIKSLVDEVAEAYEQVSAEIAEKRRLQKQEDEQRMALEVERAKRRSKTATAQIEALRAGFEESAELLKNSMLKNASAEERVNTIENMKANLVAIRQAAAEQIEEYNKEKDIFTENEVAEIWNREWLMVELVEGEPSDEAMKRRQMEEDKIRELGESDKAAYALSKANEIAPYENEWLPKLKSTYAALESDTYSVTSLDRPLTVRVADYDGSLAKWKLHISADLFGHANVFEDDIYLGYTEVTGKKVKPLSHLTGIEIEDYNQNVEIYDALFRSGAPVLYVVLHYKVMRWSEASQYHFVPTKCEVIRLGEKNKVIAKIAEKDLNTCEFLQSPQVEIRSYNEIYSDKERVNKITVAEQKLKGTYVDPKLKSRAVIMRDNEKELKGRSSLYITGSYGQTDLFKNSYLNQAYGGYKSPSIIDVEADFTFSLSKHMFFGLGGGMMLWNYGSLYKFADESKNYDACEMMKSNVFYGKLFPGVAFTFGNHFRLFGDTGVAYYAAPCNFINYRDLSAPLTVPDADECLGISAGLGCDFVIGKLFMLTTELDYNWMYYIKSMDYEISETKGAKGFFKALGKPDFKYLEFKIGAGITW